MENILSNLIITKVYSATTLYTEANAVTERKNRPRWAVVLKYEGETQYVSNGKKYISNAENALILPKGCSYNWQCVIGGYFCCIEFESELNIDEIFSFPIKNSSKILSIFKSIERKRLEKRPLNEIESINATYSIIIELLRSSKQIYVPSSKEEKLIPAMEYISSHYTDRINNDSLAALCEISTVYFRKLFTEVYGISPINYIVSLRMKKAKEMLRTDYTNISDIALSLGYTNVYDFSRDFKKHIGVSPSKFQN